MKYFPSIFNDVIGPVMRGPSSSHCAGALRIGRMARDLMHGSINEVTIEYDTMGSLVTTHQSQGSDMGLYSGLLGCDVTDENLLLYKSEIEKHGIVIEVKYVEKNDDHPNTYSLKIENKDTVHQMKAVSKGGGMVEIIEIDSASVQINGGYFETLLYVKELNPVEIDLIKKNIQADQISFHAGNNIFVNIKTLHEIDDSILDELKKQINIYDAVKIFPVLPILSNAEVNIPFTTSQEMLNYNKDKNYELWQLALEYESIRGGITKEEVFERMENIVEIIQNAVAAGLKGTEYKDRILPTQSVNFNKMNNNGKLLDAGMQNLMIIHVSAIMEVKSSMGVIVAAPTAGSCGACPGAISAAVKFLNKDKSEMINAMLIAGLIGVFISYKSTFAAEEAGCQAETGAGAAMASAALVYLAGGTVEQSLNAASMAIQNSLGLICDPIANRVEAPCIGRNVMAAVNALACANMALANYLHLIPLDEAIEVYDQVGRKISRELRCTGLGGLSITKSSKVIESKLNR